MKKMVLFASHFICMIIFCFCIISENVNAENSNIVTIEPKMEYGQTEARTILEMINDFRTGEDAWAWNEANNEKIVYSGLSELQYDYQLEQIAMQRAAEVAIAFSHTRPNGESCFTAFGDYRLSAYGENIAAGQETGTEVFKAWQETEELYAGQGHRRNMLSPDFNIVGIGHVYYCGYHYWVQEFGYASSIAGIYNPADDSEKKVSIEVRSSDISNLSLECSTKKMTMEPGEKCPLPEVVVMAQFEEHWPGGACPIFYPLYNSSENTADNALTWLSEDESIVVVSAEGEIEAIAEGKTTITAKYGDLTAVCNITVSSSGSSKEDKEDNNLTESSDNNKKDDQQQTTKIETNITITKGKKIQINIPDSFTGKITFTSKNKKIATISKKGVIKAKKRGQAKIILKSGSKKVVLKVTVK